MKLIRPLGGIRQLAPLTLALISAAIAVAAYLQALKFPFLLDDIAYIVWNTKLAGLHPDELWRLFTGPYNDFSEFLPLRDLSYWFDISLFGLNPAAFRLHNIILYLLCLPLVYATSLGLWRYFRPSDSASASWAATAVSSLFALHPAHVEAVVWISSRKDVLSTLFSLIALWLALNAKREQGLSHRYAAASLLAFLAALLSKATAVAVSPVIAIIWMYFWSDIPVQFRRRSQLLWPLSVLLLAACFGLIFSANSTVKESVYFGLEAITRLLAVLGWMARLAVSPESRHLYYPVFEDAYLPYRIALGLAVLTAAVIAGAMSLRKRTLEGFALIAFLLLCMPYTQLLPYVTDSLVSDRFLVLAVWPAMLLVVSLSWRLNPVPRTALLIVIALAWVFHTVERPRDWRSFESLVDKDLRAYPGYYMPAVYKITSFQLPRGQYRDAENTAGNITTPEIRDVMIRIIRIHHGSDADAATTGKLQEAMAQLWRLGHDIKRFPVQTRWNQPLNNLWLKLPSLLAMEWGYLAARFPDDTSVHYNAGLWMLDAHRYDDAVPYLRFATQSPQLPKHLRGNAYSSLGVALLGSGHTTEAEAPLLAALEQSPPEPSAYCSLSYVYKQTGRLEEATRTEIACPVQ
jgi:protein O-mannosyl-transferase